MHKDITVADNAKQTTKPFLPKMKKSTELIFLTNWRRNTLSEPAH